MEELKKGLEISLHDEKAHKAVERVYQQVHDWGLVLPNVKPLVMDFGLGDFENIGEVEFWIANETEAGYCGKFLFVFDGQTCPKHCHKEKLETFFIVRGKVNMSYDDKEFVMQAGDVLRVEVGKYHRFTGIGPCLLLEVSKPSIIADNYFENINIPIGGNYRA
ncbi:MAG: D-lyxose/D-mannose family sugar isomerase [bacterium]|nr:D-lyxose/D-mannose family sugar isomerase [bacterium]